MNSLQNKVEHVCRAEQSRLHECHWPGCTKQIPPAMWGCHQHWYKLPRLLRMKIWRAYRPGQEDDKRPSREYLQVAHAAQDWIRNNAT